MTKNLISVVALAALLAGCMNTGNNADIATYGTEGFGEETLVTGAPDTSLNNAYLLAAAPKYYIGNPYKVEGVQYVPAEDFTYNQSGVAGIIPAELNGTKTSNGETFDVNQMVATSKTLPLPTIARVTNLDNGESVIVRVNNRGPFVNTRIMDLSPAAAGRIGLNGTAKVQIQVLADQSMAVKNATLGTTVTAPAEEQLVTVEPLNNAPAAPVAAAGEYSVQVAAFYAEDSANAMAARMRTYGDARVVKEGDMFKVRITDLDATQARQLILKLRDGAGENPGLLKNGRWVNPDSI